MIILAGDIGGTHSRLAYYDADGKLDCLVEEIYPSAEYSGLDAIVRDFVATHSARSGLVCLAVAGPVRKGQVRTTNLPWVVDASHLAQTLALEHVTLINDLEAIAYSIDVLQAKDLETLNEGDAKAVGNMAVVAAGTGLGEAGLYWDGSRHRPIACEGGHTDFAPTDELQDELLRHLRAQFGHVSWERLVCGPGLVRIYNFLRDFCRGNEPESFNLEMEQGDPATQITRRGIEGTNPLCVQALELFVTLYGNEAGNLALKIMATGGVYLGGGIAPKIMNKLRGPSFLKAFSTKGRMSDILQAIPIKVILNEDAGLLGAAHCAALRS